MLAFPEYSQARPHGWWRTVTLRWLEYFYSSQWEKKNICCPLSEALALGRQPESLLVRTRHTAPRTGAPTASAGGQGPGTACLLSEGTGDSPSPVRQGQGTAFPHSAGAGASPPSFSLTPPCLDLPKAPRSFLWSQNKARVAGPLGGRGRRAPGPSATCRIGGFLSRQ